MLLVQIFIFATLLAFFNDANAVSISQIHNNSSDEIEKVFFNGRKLHIIWKSIYSKLNLKIIICFNYYQRKECVNKRKSFQSRVSVYDLNALSTEHESNKKHFEDFEVNNVSVFTERNIPNEDPLLIKFKLRSTIIKSNDTMTLIFDIDCQNVEYFKLYRTHQTLFKSFTIKNNGNKLYIHSDPNVKQYFYLMGMNGPAKSKLLGPIIYYPQTSGDNLSKRSAKLISKKVSSIISKLPETICYNVYCRGDHTICIEWTCKCESGYRWRHFKCIDINECLNTNKCHKNALCVNTIGSYKCTCKKGYFGDGFDCRDSQDDIEGGAQTSNNGENTKHKSSNSDVGTNGDSQGSTDNIPEIIETKDGENNSAGTNTDSSDSNEADDDHFNDSKSDVDENFEENGDSQDSTDNIPETIETKDGENDSAGTNTDSSDSNEAANVEENADYEADEDNHSANKVSEIENEKIKTLVKEHLCFQYKEKVYVLINETRSWRDAKLFCEEYDMTLTKIYDFDHFIWFGDLMERTGTESVWIGLKGEPRRSNFVWTDGQIQPAFRNFAPYNTMKMDQCLHNSVVSNGFVSSDCGDEKFFICENQYVIPNCIS